MSVKELNQKLILSLEKQLKDAEARHLKAVENLKKEMIMAQTERSKSHGVSNNKDLEFYITQLEETRSHLMTLMSSTNQ